jgi:DHA1 family tetracycline resistance protein-like MFS transporter
MSGPSATSTHQSALASKSISWRHWIEPWFLAYGLQGVTIAGLAPILLPLTVVKTGGAVNIGLIMAMFNLGGLAAPLWGFLADHFRLHRSLLIGGLVITTGGLFFFPFTSSVTAWAGLALLQGAGAAAASTVANLFIVEKHPNSEWELRIGWLQTFYGGGQVIGLLLAGLLGQISISAGLFFAALMTAIACLTSLVTIHVANQKPQERPVLLHSARHGEWPTTTPQRLYHSMKLASLGKMGNELASPFGLFLISWLLSFCGTAAVFALFPVLMQQIFQIQPSLSSSGFALAAGLGLLLYTPAGNWAKRFGASQVLQAGLLVRLLAFICLLILGVTNIGQGWLALLPFVLVVLAWSLLSVSSTTRAAQLSTVGEGEGLGIFNAVTALAGVVGAGLGGWIASRFGYHAVVIFALFGIFIALILSLIKSQRKSI